MRRVFYSDSVGVGNAGNGFYWNITNYGYPDFEFRGPVGPVFNQKATHHWITPLYHYGEDGNPAPFNDFTGRHGMPFGTRVRISNEIASLLGS